MRAKSIDAPGKPASTKKRRRKVHKRRARGLRRGSGARPPGARGGSVVLDAPEKRPYRPHTPHFPLTRDEVVAKCLDLHLPLDCAGEALALMDLMEQQQCTMQHLNDISGVAYATIHALLSLEVAFNTLIRVRLVTALDSSSMEFACLAYLNLLSRGLLRLG